MTKKKKKRKAVYNPEADKRWREKNPDAVKYTRAKSAAKSFINNLATIEDLNYLKELINERMK